MKLLSEQVQFFRRNTPQAAKLFGNSFLKFFSANEMVELFLIKEEELDQFISEIKSKISPEMFEVFSFLFFKF